MRHLHFGGRTRRPQPHFAIVVVHQNMTPRNRKRPGAQSHVAIPCGTDLTSDDRSLVMSRERLRQAVGAYGLPYGSFLPLPTHVASEVVPRTAPDRGCFANRRHGRTRNAQDDEAGRRRRPSWLRSAVSSNRGQRALGSPSRAVKAADGCPGLIVRS